jgi:xylulokinase
MNTYIGIDLGTSSVKLLLMDKTGKLLAEASENYPAFYPRSGWSEQNPADWWNAVKTAMKYLLKRQDKEAVKAISFGGQMHGLVAIDKDDKVVCPCILWNDGRTESQVKYLNESIGTDNLLSYTANIAFAGFTAPKILWLKENELDNYSRIAKIMLPKDYIAYKLSGVHSTDYSDASDTLLLDVKNKRWSKKMCGICGVKEEWLPKLFESCEVTGNILPEISDELELPRGVKIVAGAGDNAAAAIGTGTIGDGACNISIGTSGTVFISSMELNPDKTGGIHSFCHADGHYHQMGCILSAASCTKWWMDNIVCSDDNAGEQVGIEEFLGKNEVIFLPYMMGERSPHNDTSARSLFIGMRPDTTKKEMLLAIFEGVAFAIKDCIEAVRENGITITKSTLCGGGAKSGVWKRIFADILGIEIQTVETEQGPGYGAAILAMVAAGEYSSVAEAAAAFIHTKEAILPNREIFKSYQNKYELYKKLYPALKGIYQINE